MPRMEPYVHIKKAKNGWVIDASSGDTTKTYVYDSLEDAFGEIKGIFSVVAEEKKDNPKKDEY